MAFALNPSENLPFGQPSQFAPNNPGGISNYSTGSIVMDASAPVAAVVAVGFTPRKVRITDITAGTKIEFIDMFPANTTLNTAATGAITVPTTGQITIQDRQFTVSAAALLASHTYVFEAWA